MALLQSFNMEDCENVTSLVHSCLVLGNNFLGKYLVYVYVCPEVINLSITLLYNVESAGEAGFSGKGNSVGSS